MKAWTTELPRPAVIRALAVIAAAGAFFWFAQTQLAAPELQLLALQGNTMGTTWQVQVVTGGPVSPEPLAATLQQRLQGLDRDIFSGWSPDSELSRLNRQAPGVPLQVSPELFDVLQLAVQLHAASAGAFDISVGALVNLWGFGPVATTAVPDPDAIAAALAQTGLHALMLEPATRSVTLLQPLTLDLSGIAKGYAVDVVADLLQAQGYRDFLVEIGGELRLQGRRPDGQGWRIALETPTDDLRTAFARIDSRGMALALAGSGDYRNFREADGKRYSHEIDPRTGYPVDHNLAAVTLAAATAAAADAWATALMVLGPEQGPLLAAREGLAAYFIMRGPEGWQARHTDAFAPYLADSGPARPPALQTFSTTRNQDTDDGQAQF